MVQYIHGLVKTLFSCFVFCLSGCSSSLEKLPAVTHIVEIRSMQFQPAELLVNKGDTVVFINRDIVIHDVTEMNMTWASSALSTDQEYRMVVYTGVQYYCSIHPVMKGKLICNEGTE